VYVERAGSNLTGEHGRTGTQELSWVTDFQAGRPQRQRRHYPALRDCDKVPAVIQLTVIAAAPALLDHHIFLEAPHGTELASVWEPRASEIGITPQRRVSTNPPTPNLRASLITWRHRRATRRLVVSPPQPGDAEIGSSWSA
jgi:hypothetical protein